MLCNPIGTDNCVPMYLCSSIVVAFILVPTIIIQFPPSRLDNNTNSQYNLSTKGILFPEEEYNRTNNTDLQLLAGEEFNNSDIVDIPT